MKIESSSHKKYPRDIARMQMPKTNAMHEQTTLAGVLCLIIESVCVADYLLLASDKFGQNHNGSNKEYSIRYKYTDECTRLPFVYSFLARIFLLIKHTLHAFKYALSVHLPSSAARSRS